MSLVAYADSSDEESGSENENDQANEQSPSKNVLNDHISDEDEYEGTALATSTQAEPPVQLKKFSLPAPKKIDENEPPDEEELSPVLAFDKLPRPKPIADFEDIVEEEDEFLQKKEKPSGEEKPPPPPRMAARKGPVKITIPSLSEFKDLEVSKRSSEKLKTSFESKSSGLLNLLPKPKNESVFENPSARSTATEQPRKPVTSLIPDSVKNNSAKKAAQKPIKQPPKRKNVVVHANDSEDSDEEATDFFALNSNQELPAVSENEIRDMVAKKAAEIAKDAQKVNEMLETKPYMPESSDVDVYQQTDLSPSPREADLDKQAIQALMGSRAKRQKMEEVNIVELSANEVLPDKGEWLRTALASSTSYQPKGVLVDEEPAPGTRRKHQITYLAHQAKANELELQAMWAANRHTRRQTQGKYGF